MGTTRVELKSGVGARRMQGARAAAAGEGAPSGSEVRGCGLCKYALQGSLGAWKSDVRQVISSLDVQTFIPYLHYNSMPPRNEKWE